MKRTRRRPRNTRFRWLRLAALAVGLVGCGDDAQFFFAFRSGTVASDPSCSGSGGSFDLRQTTGFTVLVVFESDDAVISVGGTTLGCSALQRGGAVDVSGVDSGGQFAATEVVVR